jgi:hypothetical protein
MYSGSAAVVAAEARLVIQGPTTNMTMNMA